MKNSTLEIFFGSFMITAIVFTFAVTAQAAPDEVIDDTTKSTAQLSTTVETSKRRPVYFTTLLTGGVLHEDWNNRLTSHSTEVLLTPGLALRAGGVIKNKHLVGARFQGSWRSTQSSLDSLGGDSEWGAVSSYYIGPEYRYLTDSGMYFGLTTGITLVMSDNDVGSGGSPDCDSDWCVEEHFRTSEDHGAFGLGVIGMVGYEHRVSSKFALSIEAYVGVFEGEDENYQEMTTATYGIAFGIGI